MDTYIFVYLDNQETVLGSKEKLLGDIKDIFWDVMNDIAYSMTHEQINQLTIDKILGSDELGGFLQSSLFLIQISEGEVKQVNPPFSDWFVEWYYDYKKTRADSIKAENKELYDLYLNLKSRFEGE
jgi:hypothetical protein